MVSSNSVVLSFCFAIGLSICTAFWSLVLPGAESSEAFARVHHSVHHAAGSRAGGARHGGAHHAAAARHAGGQHRGSHHLARHGRLKLKAHGHKGRHAHIASSEAAPRKKHAAPDNKHAYALDFFMMRPPEIDRSPMEEDISAKVRDAFARGIADDLPAEKLVRAGVFNYYPLSGGIFKRREPVKYIVLHSTETGPPVPAKNVIVGWNSMGRRHPGAQFVVDRDGTIYMALDPELASVHVNIFKTLPGINNDNSIGIEMNHTGRQDYPAAELRATTRLVTYLQHRFNISSDNVISHRYAQQGDHTDPVNFSMNDFLAGKEDFRNRAIALKRAASPLPFEEETEDDAPLASIYVQIHGQISMPVASTAEPATKSQTLTPAGPLPPAPDAAQAAGAAIAMPRGTFVAGGQMQSGASRVSENQPH